MNQMNTCGWSVNVAGENYRTDCGEFVKITATEYGSTSYKFCPFCGSEIIILQGKSN